MKKVAILAGLAVIAITLALAWPQLGTGQFFRSSNDESDEAQLQQEIHMLKLINELELSVEQMTGIKDQLALIRTSHTAVKAANAELRDFLVSFKGTREEHREAVKPFLEKVAQAEEAQGKQLQSSVEAVKDLLTLRQGEILQEHFSMMLPMLMEHPMSMAPEALEQMHAAPGMSQGSFQLHIHGSANFDPSAVKKFKENMEKLGDRMEAWGENLGQQLERWFERWDMDSDEDVDGDGEWEIYLPNTGAQMFQAPAVRVRMAPQAMMMLGSHLAEFLFEHLELLDKVLTDKLINMGATPQGTPESSI